MYGVLTLVIIFVTNLRFLTMYLLSDTNDALSVEGATFGDYFGRVVDVVEKLPFLPNSAVFVFWSLVGLVVYSLIQSIYNVYAEVKNDIDITTHFMHPSNYIRWKFWVEVVLQLLAHISLYVLTVLGAFLVGYVLAPLAAVFTRQLVDGPSLESLVRFISSGLLLYIGVLVFALILKIFFKRKQLAI